MFSKQFNLGIGCLVLGLGVPVQADEADAENQIIDSGRYTVEVKVTAQRTPLNAASFESDHLLAADTHTLVLRDLTLRLRAIESGDENEQTAIDSKG